MIMACLNVLWWHMHAHDKLFSPLCQVWSCKEDALTVRRNKCKSTALNTVECSRNQVSSDTLNIIKGSVQTMRQVTSLTTLRCSTYKVTHTLILYCFNILKLRPWYYGGKSSWTDGLSAFTRDNNTMNTWNSPSFPQMPSNFWKCPQFVKL